MSRVPEVIVRVAARAEPGLTSLGRAVLART
jgi:hypothetical protein